jgi:glycosyltransferase involved in cell wall biosynthesis
VVGNNIIYVVNSDWFFLSHRLPLAQEAIKRGYRVILVSKDTGKRSLVESYGIQFIDVDFESSSQNPLKDAQLIFKLRNIYKQYNPKIIHHVTIKPVLYGTIAARYGTPNLSAVVNAVAGLGYVFTSSERYIVRFWVKQLMRIAFKNIEARFIFQNPDDLGFFKKMGFVGKSKYVLIKGSGVDENEYAYTPAIAKEKLQVLLSARMIKDKGVVEFIEAAIKLKQRWMGKVEFILLGGIDTNNPTSLSEDFLRKCQVEGYITWLGHQSNMFEYCKQADIVCLPSFYREGVPKSLIEAMAVGRPIVTTDSAGCRECVDDGINGILIPIKNSEKLAEAIDYLLNNETLRIKMGKASREKMLTGGFSLKQVVHQTFELYDTPLKNHESKDFDSNSRTQ